MREGNITEIEKVESLLSDAQREQEIASIEDNDENRELINYLDNLGNTEFYFAKDSSQIYDATETRISLWHKHINQPWKVNLYNIRRFKANQ